MIYITDKVEDTGMGLCEVHSVETGDVINFRENIKNYGRHQWDVRLFSGVLTEVQLAELRTIFTDPEYLRYHNIDPFNVFFAGLRGGWLVVDQELSISMIRSISELVRMFHRAPRMFYQTYIGMNTEVIS